VCQVSTSNGRLRLPLDTMGPFLGAIGTSGFGALRCRVIWNFHPLNSRLPKSRHDWILHHASFGWTAAILPCTQYGLDPLRYLRRTFLFAISRQPLICSYGWVQTIDTIILPARLILSPKRTSYVRCAWALLVQPVDLDILMPKTSNVANIRLHGG
jgi:hypothetical protein